MFNNFFYHSFSVFINVLYCIYSIYADYTAIIAVENISCNHFSNAYFY